MDDRIIYNEHVLSTAAAELGKLADIMSDVESQLNKVDTSAEWWSHIKGTGGDSAVGQVRALRKNADSLGKRSTQIKRGVDTTIDNFNRAERDSNDYAQRLLAGRIYEWNADGTAAESGGSWWSDFFGEFWKNFGWSGLLAGSGYIGKLFGFYQNSKDADSLWDILKNGKKFKDFLKEAKKTLDNYLHIGRAVGKGKALGWWFKKVTGLKVDGYLSKAGSWWKRFRNNLTNKTSPFRHDFLGSLKDKLGDFAGKNGKGKAVATWFDTLVTGVTNFFGNKEEQAASGGTMSNGRVWSETVMETVVDTVFDATASAAVGSLVGAALAATLPAAAVPLVVTAVSGAVVAGVNLFVEKMTGKSACEWVSDGILDGLEAVGRGLKTAKDKVAGWFKQRSAAPAW